VCLFKADGELILEGRVHPPFSPLFIIAASSRGSGRICRDIFLDNDLTTMLLTSLISTCFNPSSWETD
jgi:hypothetical protein